MTIIGRQYKAHRDNAIDLFRNYKLNRGEAEDGVNIEHLERRIKSLQDGKFTLAVAGEVKAGKSTFINALLGSEILPSDVLQSSSAIVEIFKSESCFLKVRYADGNEETLYDDPSTIDINEANARLHEICRIHDKYRCIPTTLIDEYIVEREGLISVDADFVQRLERESQQTLNDSIDTIAKYISDRPKSKIPVAIEYGHPLGWEFDELRIVDSPGVNARGGVQDVSFRYLEEANAILFVHKIKPVESESFREFVNTTISDRSKETLFLILTHAGDQTDDEIHRLLSEAKRLYRDVIPEDRILAVDSLLKLIHCELQRGVSVEDIRKVDKKKKILASYRETAQDEDRDLGEVLLEASRFTDMLSAIDEFSMKAPTLQLKEVLEKIKDGYTEQDALHSESIKRLNTKKKHPQKFDEEIERINSALDKYLFLAKQTTENLRTKYQGRHSPWIKEVNQLKAKYPELITESKSIAITRKRTVDGLAAVQARVDSFSKEITNEVSCALEEIGAEFQKENQICIPKVDLKALEEKAKESAYVEQDVYKDRSVDLWDIVTIGISRLFRENKVKTGTKRVIDNERYLAEYKTSCNQVFYDIVNCLPSKGSEVLNSYITFFSREIDQVINDRQTALEKEKQAKLENEEIRDQIAEHTRKKKTIHPERMRCIEVMEDLR